LENEDSSKIADGVQTMPQTNPLLDADDPIPGLSGHTVGDFWQWAYSDILSNRNRSIFAEFIVGVALGVVDKPRVEWEPFDFQYGNFRIEVKSAAYVQNWKHKKLSTIRFDIGKALFWNRAKGEYEGKPTRCADLYVFCHYTERDKAKANVLHVPAWDFYVVSTAILNREFGEAKSLSLEAVKRVAAPCKWEGLKMAVVDQVAATPQGASK
jgi:hypothetical protein